MHEMGICHVCVAFSICCSGFLLLIDIIFGFILFFGTFTINERGYVDKGIRYRGGDGILI
jgi:hypothetical protein